MHLEAYDNDAVAGPKAAHSATVRLLIVQSTQYGDELKYTVNADTTDRVLDQPHVLVGAGAVGLLLGSGSTTLHFANALGHDAEVQILVGRDATP